MKIILMIAKSVDPVANAAEFPNYDVFLSLKIVLMIAKSVDPDEMPQNFLITMFFCPRRLF